MPRKQVFPKFRRYNFLSYIFCRERKCHFQIKRESWKISPSHLLISVFLCSFIFGCAGSSCCAQASSGCGKRGCSSLPCVGFSRWWLLLFWNMGSRACTLRCLRLLGSRAQAQWLWHLSLVALQSCGIFPDQGSNPWLLHWQADSLPLRHQESPLF